MKATNSKRTNVSNSLSILPNMVFLVFSEDITNSKLIEKEMLRLESLNLSGEIACSICHEIRNLITTVRGFLQMMKTKQELAGYDQQLDLMIGEIDRANTIITEFLSVAKQKKIVRKKQNLNDIVNRQLLLIKANALVSNHILKIELQEIADLCMDEAEIRQLVLNLISNAFEATPMGKVVTVKTYSDGDGIVLDIVNEGKKIEAKILEKMGTPFFTTKENGTGLGLSVCYRIAERHDANILIENEAEKTTFHVRFKTNV